MALVSINGLIYGSLSASAFRPATTLVNGTTFHTITGGPIQIIAWQLQCVTANDGTASTLQFNSTPTLGSAKTLSAASATLASATIGTTINMNMTSLATAPDIVTGGNGGVNIGANIANLITVSAGLLTIVVATGSTTGTWASFLSYIPMAPNVIVV